MPQHIPLNTRVINVAHTLIIHVKDVSLLGVSNCQELRRPRSPSLFEGRPLSLRKELLNSSSVSGAEGRDLKDKRQKRGLGIHYDPFHPNSNTFKCLPISAAHFFTSRLHLSSSSSHLLTLFFCVHHPLLRLFNHKRLAASGIKPRRDV